MMTWFNQQIAISAPTKMDISLPCQFQIGDEVEIVTGDGFDVIPATVFGVRFCANGAVYYDLAVPVAGTSSFAVANNVRGNVRKKGGNETAEQLSLTNIEEVLPFVPEMRRAAFRIVGNPEPSD